MRKLKALEHFREALHAHQKHAWGKAEQSSTLMARGTFTTVPGHKPGPTEPKQTKSTSTRNIHATDILHITKVKLKQEAMGGFRTHKDTTLSALLAGASTFRLLFCGGFTAEFLKSG